MEHTYGLLCTVVSFVACLIFIGIIITMLGNAILTNPGLQQLIRVLGL